MDKAKNEQQSNEAERVITVNNMKVHIKSVFNGHRTIDDALIKIIAKRLAKANN